jgi:hypothetical protein
MKLRSLPRILAVFVLAAAAAAAQDSATAPPSTQNSGSGNSGGYGQRGGHGMGMMSRGVTGTVTEVAADRYTIKTEMGEIYTVHFSADTRIVKLPAATHGPGGGNGGQEMGGGYGRMNGGNPPQQIKASDIKVGDAIVAMGDNDATARSVSATHIIQLDPDTAKHMQEMAANFGKTWLSGKVTAMNQTTITLTGTLDKAPHTIVVDENTAFRRQRDPLTLADIQVGDTIGVLGVVKNGVFTATVVDVRVGMGDHPHDEHHQPPAAAPPGPGPSAPPQ